MGEEIPVWALEAAISRVAGQWSGGTPWTAEEAATLDEGWARMTRLAAKLIAEHEQPPVDWLLEAARRIAYNELRHMFGPGGRSGVADTILAGGWDDHQLVATALQGIKRGMELAK